MERKDRIKALVGSMAVIGLGWVLSMNSSGDKVSESKALSEPIPTPPTVIFKNNPTTTVQKIEMTPTLAPIPTPKNTK